MSFNYIPLSKAQNILSKLSIHALNNFPQASFCTCNLTLFLLPIINISTSPEMENSYTSSDAIK